MSLSSQTEKSSTNCGPSAGVAFCAVPAIAAFAAARLVPTLSPLLVAMLLGMAVAAVAAPGARYAPGLAFSARHLLRAGIVLLGLQVSLQAILDLGPRTVVLIIVVVCSGIAFSMTFGRVLGLSWTQRLLVACGFSICGAAAIAAVDDAVDAEERETATAIAMVVLFGTGMIGVVSLGAAFLDLDDATAGTWAGASIHEVAQVIAAGGVIGGSALTVAVVVKLGRVLLLAPVILWVTWRQRARLRKSDAVTTLPRLVPTFVLGFLVMVAVRTWVGPPEVILRAAHDAQTLLLGAAMFALGCGVRLSMLRAAGSAVTLLAAATTVWVAGVGLLGAMLVC